MRVESGTSTRYIYFVAVDATDFTTRETGLASFTVYRSRNGGAAAAMTTPTINEVDSVNMPGVYELLLDEDMTIDAGDDSQEMVFHITHAGMAPVTRTIELYRSKITAGETLTVSSGNANSAVQSIAANAITATAIATDAITSAKLAANCITSSELDGTAVAEIWNYSTRALTDKAGFTISGTLTTLDALDTAQDSQHSTTQGLITALNDPTAAAIADAVWDEVITGAFHNVNNSAAKFLRESAETITGVTGTAQSGTANTIQLASGAVSTNDIFNGERVAIIEGTGAGQSRIISDSDAATDTLTVSNNWIVNPDATSVYAITGAESDVRLIRGQLATATGAVDFDDLATILVDTNELQTNQGNWLTATGFATAAALATVDSNVDAILVDTSTTIPAQITGLNDPTAAAIADAVWDEAKAGHVGVGSFGEEVQAHALSTEISALNDPSAAAIRAEIDSNSTQLAAIVADTNELQTDWGNGGRLDLIIDELTTQGDTNATLISNVVASGTSAWSTATGFSTASDVNTAATNIVASGTAAWTTIDSAAIRSAVGLSSANLDTQLSTIDNVVDGINVYVQTSGVTVATDSKTGYSLSSTGLDSVVMAEPGSVVSLTGSIVDGISWLTALNRNKVTQTSTTLTLRNDADDADIATSAVSDDGSTAIRGEFT